MLIFKILFLLLPWIGTAIFYMLGGTPEYIAYSWIGVSPIWGAMIAFFFFWEGRAIEVVETAKFAVNTVNENKHHAINAFNFLKRKVAREKS